MLAPSLALALALLLSQRVAPTSAQVVFKLARCTLTGEPNQLGWHVTNKTVDGLTATNLIDAGLHGATVGKGLNCPGETACHSWGPSFGDRNDLFQLVLPSGCDSADGRFQIHSWPVTKSVPVGPGQTPPGQCVTAMSDSGLQLAMRPVGSDCLELLGPDAAGQMRVVGPLAFADHCLDAHPPGWTPPPPPPPPPAPPPHSAASAARLAPCGGAHATDQQWRLADGALQLVAHGSSATATARCLDFGAANGLPPLVQPCFAGARSQAVQQLPGSNDTLLLAAAGYNASVMQGSTPQALPNVSALCLAADRTFTALVMCGSLSRIQQWTLATNGSLAVTSSGLCLTADIPVQPEASVVVEVGVLAGGQRARPFRHWWKTAVGSGHAALTLRADWREHMSMAREHCGFESVRFHGMHAHAVQRPNDNSCCISLLTYRSFGSGCQC